MAELSFASGESSLSVRRFSVREAVSALFEAEIEALSPNEDLDLEALVGGAAALRLPGALGEPDRLFRGVVRAMEQIRVEPSGLSTYAVHLVPALWMLTQREGYRVFQHRTTQEIVRSILGEHGIEAAFRVDAAAEARLEYRVQYGESDHDFVSRLLEDAGISFVFVDREDAPALLFSDDLRSGEERRSGPIAWIDEAGLGAASGRSFVTEVRLAHEVRPGKLTIRDVDFRKSASFQLVGAAEIAEPERRYERYRYLPGSFLVETGARGEEMPVADGAGAARHDPRVGKALAQRELGRERSSKRAVSFRTNTHLAPGTVFTIALHPRPDLGADRRLLVTEIALSWSHDGEYRCTGKAAFLTTDQPYLPKRSAARPRIHGVQSAVVVGPAGHEIHTDELGRVRVQFPWDREGRFDEHSSCWIRVSQGWAGGAFGMMALPRVGQEVLVGFIEGDPDQPVVVGRVYNAAARVPYKLPENQTVSTWKGASTPGSEGSNEIAFEDAKGSERIFLHAERDLEEQVKGHASLSVDRDRTKAILGGEAIDVGGSRRTTIGAVDEVLVGTRHAISIAARGAAGATGIEMTEGRIALTTGEATITLEGAGITLDSAARILLRAASDIALEAEANITVNADVRMTLNAGSKLIVRSAGGDVVIQGGPIVRINPETGGRPVLTPAGAPIPIEIPPGVDLDDEMAIAEEHARRDPAAPTWFEDQTKPGGAWDFAAKGEQYRDFAAFHQGLVGKAMGFPEGAILRQAGVRRRAQGDADPAWGDPGNGLWGGRYPYGADPRDQALIKQGFAHHDATYGV
jgi:type VI secretion system secreted protein VgrG